MENKPTALDCSCTEAPICPHCGHAHQDAWEWCGEEGTHQCDECGEPFKWAREVIESWDTEKVS